MILGIFSPPNDKITLYIPDIYQEYPDFVGEGWALAEVESFCEKYKISLDIVYEETDDYKAGTIIRQSRKAKDRIVENTKLKITIAKEMSKVEEPTQDNTDANTDNNQDNTNNEQQTP